MGSIVLDFSGSLGFLSGSSSDEASFLLSCLSMGCLDS